MASASSLLSSKMCLSVPSSKPRYTPIGPSTRCTIRQPWRANRRRRRSSKLNELKRQTGVPPEMRFTSTSSPRRCSSPTRPRETGFPARRRRREVVEHGQVCAAVSRGEPSSLRPGRTAYAAPGPADVDECGTRLRTKVHAQKVDEAVDPEDVKTFTAPAGALVLCNTSGFHRGGFATAKPRVLATATYARPRRSSR